MFIFFELINSTDYRRNKISLLENLKDANEIITELSLIKEHFNSMERLFNKKFDEVIVEYKNTLHDLYFEPLKTKEQREVGTSLYGSSPLEHVLSDCLFEKIIPKIVFHDFLLFYDEFSYTINEQIWKLHKKFSLFNNTPNTLSAPQKPYFENEMNQIIFNNAEYLDLHYFLNKLEEKLARGFEISINEIRNILYGCKLNSKDNESQTKKHIQEFYNIVLINKRFCFSSNTNYDVKFDTTGYFEKDHIEEEKSMQNSLDKNSFCFTKDFTYIHDYHKKFLTEFPLSITRFFAYEILLLKYGREENFPHLLNKGEDILLLGYEPLYGDTFCKSTLFRHFFRYMNYQSNYNNDFFKYFEEIKAFLKGLLS